MNLNKKFKDKKLFWWEHSWTYPSFLRFLLPISANTSSAIAKIRLELCFQYADPVAVGIKINKNIVWNSEWYHHWWAGANFRMNLFQYSSPQHRPLIPGVSISKFPWLLVKTMLVSGPKARASFTFVFIVDKQASLSSKGITNALSCTSLSPSSCPRKMVLWEHTQTHCTYQKWLL